MASAFNSAQPVLDTVQCFEADVTLNATLSLDITNFKGAKRFRRIVADNQSIDAAGITALMAVSAAISSDGTSATLYGWRFNAAGPSILAANADNAVKLLVFCDMNDK